MSAYICNPEHIGAMAAYDRRRGVDDAIRVARDLMQANIDAVKTRYPYVPDNALPGPCKLPHDLLQLAEMYAAYYYRRGRFPAVAMLKMITGYEYQACELADWEKSEAYRKVGELRAQAIQGLQGYAQAAWEYSEENPPPDIEKAESDAVRRYQGSEGP